MISLIVALDDNKLIGKDKGLPWNIPEDLAKFKEITMGNVIIMGRKTFQGIGRALPGRINIVITRDKSFNADGIYTFDTVDGALKKAFDFNKDVFFIGGSEIYNQVLNIVDKMCISHIFGSHDGDSYFPKIDFEEFNIIKEEKHKNFIYREYIRKISAF
jgi:dihydrofolate reductase